MNRDVFLTKSVRRVAKISKEKGLGQDKLYLAAGLARKTIYGLETGQVDLRATTLLKVAQTLQVSSSELIDIRQ